MEIWKDIQGYEDVYQVSNLGNIRSMGAGRRLKASVNKSGYMIVSLAKNGKRAYFYVHRLVAQAFIPNPNGLPVINHLDEIKVNNTVGNLEWCTQKHNLNHGLSRRKKSKPIVQLDINGRLIKKWDNQLHCDREGFSKSAVWSCCNGRYFKNNTYKGFVWMYEDQYVKNGNTMESKNKIEVPLSFIKGFKLLNDYQKEECKSAIMKGLGITTDQGFGKRMRGEVEHGVIEAKIIENAFRECGVKAKDVWGS